MGDNGGVLRSDSLAGLAGRGAGCVNLLGGPEANLTGDHLASGRRGYALAREDDVAVWMGDDWSVTLARFCVDRKTDDAKRRQK